jgi:hypothetical protein
MSTECKQQHMVFHVAGQLRQPVLQQRRDELREEQQRV